VEEPEPVTVRAAIDGDLASFEELVRTYQAAVWRFLKHMLGDRELAEDVTQETFLRVYQRLRSFRFDAKFSTWVFQIARNAGLDALRSRSRRLRLVDVAPPPARAPDPHAGAELGAALASLSPKLREALLLVEILGLSYRETATVLREPEGTAKSRVFHARERLAGWMAAGQAGEA